MGRNRLRNTLPLKKKRKTADETPESNVPPSLGDFLVSDGVLTEDQLWDASDAQASSGLTLAEVLMTRGLASESQITRAYASLYGVAFVLLDDVIPTPEAVAVVPAEIAEAYLVLPLSLETRGDSPTLRLAMVNPWDAEFLTLLQERTGCKAVPILAGEQDLLVAVARAYAPFAAEAETQEETKFDAPVLTDVLIAQGVISEAQRDEIAAEEDESGRDCRVILRARGWADDEQIARAQAVLDDLPYASLSVWSPTSEALARVPYDLAARFLLLPLAFFHDDDEHSDAAPRLQVAVASAWDDATRRDIESQIGCALEPFLAAEASLLDALDRAYPGPESVIAEETKTPQETENVEILTGENASLDAETEPEIAADEDAGEPGTPAVADDWIAEDDWVNVEDETPESDALAQIPYEIAQYYQVLPLARMAVGENQPHSLRVAMAETERESEVVTLIEKHLACRVKPMRADADALRVSIEHAYAPVAAPPKTVDVSESLPEIEAVTPQEIVPETAEENSEPTPEPLPEIVAEVPAVISDMDAFVEIETIPAGEIERNIDDLVPTGAASLAADAPPDLTPALLSEPDLLQKLPTDRASRLGDILVGQGVITPEQLALALEEQIVTQQRLGEIIMRHLWADEEEITRARSVQFEVPYLNIASVTPDPAALELLPYNIARPYQVLPLSIQDAENEPDGRLVVAMLNPWDVEVIDMVQRQARRRVEPFLASEGGLRDALERAYQDAQDDAHHLLMTDSLAQAGEGVLNVINDTEEISLDTTLQQSGEAPVVRFVNTLLSDAVRRRASDIHIEPRKHDFLLRYRVDGHLQTVRAVPRQFLAPTTSRLKIMAEMDISERRLPLDGRIALRLDDKNIDMRVSTLPSQYGERIVMRVLDRSAVRLGLEQLDFSPHNQAAFTKLIHQPHGIILVTGPTGSGKTTTLYAALNALKSPATNILTVEDPIEYELEGISQTAVNDRAGLTFAKQLRAILRQDPDVILVGEIRDAETAEIAFRAALTGHLVLSTLHCNEAAGAISRLIDMGVAPFLIASTVIGVIGQRLVRRLCPACRRETTPDARQLLLMREMAGGSSGPDTAPLRLYEPVGCPLCDKQGTRGRLAVHEVMTLNAQIHRLTMEQAETGPLRKAAIEAGMVPIISDGLEKAGLGLTTLEDVQRRLGTLHED